MAKAVGKASEVTTIAFMMVLPILPGYWLDLYFGTVPLFAIAGLVLGMLCGVWQLIKLVNRKPPLDHQDDPRDPDVDRR